MPIKTFLPASVAAVLASCNYFSVCSRVLTYVSVGLAVVANFDVVIRRPLFAADYRTSHQWIINPMTTTYAAGLTWTDSHSSNFSPNVFGDSGAFGPGHLTQSHTALLEPSYWGMLGQGDPNWPAAPALPNNFGSGWNFGSGSSEVQSLARELVILDRGVPQWEQLRDDFLAQRSGGRAIDVVVLDAAGDGIRQISQALAGYRNLQSLHIFSHGQAGALQLGGEWLHGGNLSLYANDLLGWGDSLATGADMLLYGCDVASGIKGQHFVDGLAVLVGADVAASTDLTGHSSLGGNWTFEYLVGQVESSLALSMVTQVEWVGLLNQTVNIDNTWLAANGGVGNYALKGANTTYVLQTDVNVAGTAFYVAEQNITFDLNGHTIFYGSNNEANRWGVCLYIGWHNTEIVIPNAKEPTGFTLKNGSIINQGSGDRSHGVYGNRGQGSTLRDLHIETAGKDSFTVMFNWGDTTLGNNVLITHTNATFDRHSGPANVKVGGRLVATNNVIIGGNSGFVAGSNSLIEKNIIAHSGFATNGYAGWFYRNSNVVMRDNIILPTNGRGILANAGNNHLFENNVILHLELPNAEFGTSLNPPAMRSRYDAVNIVYRNNTSLGIGGGELTAASSIYLSNDGTGTNQFVNNTATVILKGTPSTNRYAQPLTMEGQGVGTNANPTMDVISGNVFKSNHYMIRTSGYDGYTRQLQVLSHNEFHWADGNAARLEFVNALTAKLNSFSSELSARVLQYATDRIAAAVATIDGHLQDVQLQASRAFWFGKHASFSDSAGSYATIMNSVFGAGVDPTTVAFTTLNQGAVILRSGDSHRIRFVDGTTALANKSIAVSSDQGDQFTVFTDADGYADVPVIAFALTKAHDAGSQFQNAARQSSTLTLEGYASIDLDHSDIPQTINLGDSTGHRLEYDGHRLNVFANIENNLFTWSALHSLLLEIDGHHYEIQNGTTEITFHGLAGTDRLNLTGSSADDHFVLGLGSATLTTGTGLLVRALGFEEVFAAAGGGTLNQVFLNDSAGDDHFTASAGLATMLGNGFHHEVTGFQRVTANRTTGNDVATFFDSTGDDSFLSYVTFSSMSGGGFVSRANGYATVVAHASNGGFNQAFMHDSNGADLFTVSPTEASMTGTGFSHQANGFQRVTANRSGGNDVAHFYGSSGDDILLSRRDFTALTAGSFIGRVNGFDTVVAFGGQGGTDQAFMYDTPGADLFTATLGLATLTGTGYQHEVRDFHRVTAYRSSGDDAAHFHGSDFDDTFLTYLEFSSMISGSFVNRANGFTSVVGFGGSAGFDQAFMYDSAGDELFSATDGLATMTGTGFQHEARGFQRVTAHRSTGDDVAHFYDSPGNDTFLTRRQFSSLISATGINRANWFPTVVAYGGVGGVDTARFYSSADSDTFRGGFASVTMDGNGFSNRVDNFGRVHLHGIPGGVVDDFELELDGATVVTLRPQLGMFRRGAQMIEALDFAQMTVRRVGTAASAEAQLFAGAGDDVFEARPDYALMSGNGYQNRAESFAATTGRAGGVNNVAYLYGGAHDDTLAGDLMVPRLFGNGYSYAVRDFRQIVVQAGEGGQNRLNLGDSPGDDVVTVGDGYAHLVGSGVTLEAQGFTNQTVRSERGGADTVYLLSTGSANLAGMYENYTWLTNQSNSYYLRANNFSVVDVQHSGSGSNNRVNMFAPVGDAAQSLSFAGSGGQVDHGAFRRRFNGFNVASVQYRANRDNVDNQGTSYSLSLVDLG